MFGVCDVLDVVVVETSNLKEKRRTSAHLTV